MHLTEESVEGDRGGVSLIVEGLEESFAGSMKWAYGTEIVALMKGCRQKKWRQIDTKD